MRMAKVGVLLLVALLQACATVPYPNKQDPLESFNRSMFSLNDGLDRAVLKPVARGYQFVTPNWFRTGVGNFFGNLEDVWSTVNSALQLRASDTGDNAGRVMINTTLGLLGVVDVASGLKIDRHPSNFGLTLGRWGVKPGPYLVLPLMGSTTLRDAAGLPIDIQGNLINRISDQSVGDGLTLLNVVDSRASFLRAGDVVDDAALDRYSFIRDAFLQRRRNLVYDGDPPDEEPDPLQ
jgi:phospholipid-binding lipoprotein MlaA